MKTLSNMLIGAAICALFFVVPTSWYYNFWGGVIIVAIIAIVAIVWLLSQFLPKW